ncbi:MAG: CPBP family intramembrane metalloprotease [Chitinophagales bacterium]|nr:CPBP family intramembrane metalloprotease [Chitinophagales bacterium]
MNIPTWQSDNLEAILVFLLLTIGFCVYYFGSVSQKLEARYVRKYGNDTRFIHFGRYLGGLSIGIVPAIIMLVVTGKEISEYGVTTGNGLLSLYWILGIASIVVPMNYFNSRKEKHLAFYPNVREREWTPRLVVINAFSWAFYLFGYELMFRGLLLFGTLSLLGPWPAIILNVALYVLVHVPKNLEETVGAAPLGFLLCLITLTTGTIWVAFFVHVTLALSNFFFSLRHHPEMKVVRN